MRRALFAIVAGALACGDNAAPPAPHKRVVILLIGDGMGQAQVDAASLYATGAPGGLFMQSLPVRTLSASASLSGTTDSAASATTMATGARTWNGGIGIDRDGLPVETLVELAHREGLAGGVVTTTELTHATPAAFTAHEGSRNSAVEIAHDQVVDVRPEVMLGGGMGYFRPAGPGSYRGDAGLLGTLAEERYTIVDSATTLAAAPPGRLFGAFAQSHLAYVLDRPAATTEPTLAEMTRAALAHLETHERGFFLMVEGGRIDHASHANLLDHTVAETLAFDDAVRAVAAWADAHADTEITLIVTADHECGGLAVLGPTTAGTLPAVAWRWGSHTNALVPIFARGARTEVLAGEVRDHAWVWAVLAAAVRGEPFTPPTPGLLPDGRTTELRHLVAVQRIPTDFGLAQLDALRLDADATGLAIGIDGVLDWDKNALVVLIDLDLGGSTGFDGLLGRLDDTSGVADAILASSRLGPSGFPGFGADVAIVVRGGADPTRDQAFDDAGLRVLGPGELAVRPVSTNFADGVRARETALPPQPGRGWEAYVPWSSLYPGPLPRSATLGLAVLLVDSTGAGTSNQALPPFPDGTASPGDAVIALPGLVRFVVDGDGDGVADGDEPPTLLP